MIGDLIGGIGHTFNQTWGGIGHQFTIANQNTTGAVKDLGEGLEAIGKGFENLGQSAGVLALGALGLAAFLILRETKE